MLKRNEEAKLKQIISQQMNQAPLEEIDKDVVEGDVLESHSDVYGVYYSDDYKRKVREKSENIEAETEYRKQLEVEEKAEKIAQQERIIEKQKRKEQAKQAKIARKEHIPVKSQSAIEKEEREKEKRIRKFYKNTNPRARIFKGIGIVLLVFVLIFVALGIANTTAFLITNNYAFSQKPVVYAEQLAPTVEDGYVTFTCDREFRVMQLTDLHFGGGVFSVGSDKDVVDTVYNMIVAEKPDLVIVTGDISFAVPYISGTMNNMFAHNTLFDLFESMGVYYAVALGNHDSETYNYYGREYVGQRYEESPYCLFSVGPEDVNGVGNYIINVKNSAGSLVHSFVIMDSNEYTDDDRLGTKFRYEHIDQTQIDWYLDNMEQLFAINGGNKVNVSLFMHIPPVEYEQTVLHLVEEISLQRQLELYENAGMSENVSNPVEDDQLFEKATTDEDSTLSAIFCGHDHINNFVLNHPETNVKLVYGMSVDYLAYAGSYGFCRGCTMITVGQSGQIDISLESYYQTKYVDQSVIDSAPSMEREKFIPSD